MLDSDAATPSRKQPWFALALVALTLTTLFLIRADSLNERLGIVLDCANCFLMPALASDAWIGAAVFGLLAIGLLFRTRWLRLPLCLMAFAVAVPAWIDVGVTGTLGHRLHLTDALHFGTEFAVIADVTWPWLLAWPGMAVAVAAFGFTLALAYLGGRSTGGGRSAAAAALLIGAVNAALAFAYATPRYVEQSFYVNVYAVNLAHSWRRQHSPAMEAQIHATPPIAAPCHAYSRPARQASVIVLIVESWSLHHSQLFSGLDDLTPGMDALAQRGSWFPDYVANAFSTETGLIALMNGVVPIATHKSFGIAAFDDVQGDFYRSMAKRGYTTAFFTPGALSFGGREDWLKQLGLGYVEGAAHPYYADWPRGSFDAPPDRAMFSRFVEWIDAQEHHPFIATVLTTGTHPPFLDIDAADPYEPGQRAAFRRVDRDVVEFVRSLEQRSFFDNGILLVLGDHRVMTPIGTDEVLRFGDTSAVRVPAFVLGDSGLPPGALAGPFQQADLIPSLRAVITGEDCRSDWQGRMLGPSPVPAKVVAYTHPSHREEVRFLIAGAEYRLRLDGDATGWVGKAPADGQAILAETLRQRLSRDPWPPSS